MQTITRAEDCPSVIDLPQILNEMTEKKIRQHIITKRKEALCQFITKWVRVKIAFPNATLFIFHHLKLLLTRSYEELCEFFDEMIMNRMVFRLFLDIMIVVLLILFVIISLGPQAFHSGTVPAKDPGLLHMVPTWFFGHEMNCDCRRFKRHY